MSCENSITSTVALMSVLVLGCGCRIHISDGFIFDYEGETAHKTEDGIIDPGVRVVEIRNKFGDIHVESTDDGGSWIWFGQCWSNDQELADACLAELELRIDQDGDKQRWSVTLPERRRQVRGVKSNFTFNIPTDVAVVIVNEHGNASVTGLTGETSIDNEHGDVEVSDLSGATKIDVEHGNLVATRLLAESRIDCEHGRAMIDGADQSVSVKCEHCPLDIKNARAAIETDTEHAPARIESLGPTVKCETEHGDLTIIVAESEFESVVVDAEHSNVEIRIPAASQPNLDLSVDHGTASSDFEPHHSDDAPRVKVDSEHGNIRIRAIDAAPSNSDV